MARVFYFVDGFNVYHALDWTHPGDPHRYRRHKWLNLSRLGQLFLQGGDTLAGIKYFTTLPTWDAGKLARHQLYVSALRNEGVEVVFGAFKGKDVLCRNCGATFRTREEKQTDVNIALHLFQAAVADLYDKAVLISGDTDLIPALNAVRALYPAKRMGVVIPIGRASQDLKNQADFHFKMKEIHLQSAQFPDPLILRDGTPLAKPRSWA